MEASSGFCRTTIAAGPTFNQTGWQKEEQPVGKDTVIERGGNL